MNILFVEDDPETALYIIKALSDYHYRVDHEDNGLDGYKNALEGNYDVIIADRMLPRLDGLEMIKQLREQDNHTPVLILSALDEVNEIVDGLNAGADDYLTKPFSFDELLARITALVRRQPVRKNSNSTLALANVVLNRFSREVSREGIRLDLNPKEFMILEYLMLHVNALVTRAELGRHLWGVFFTPASNVLHVHISRLRKKLNANDQLNLLHTKHGVGYSLRE